MTHRRKAFKRTFEEVKAQIRQRLLRQKRSQVIKDFVKELKGKAKITIDEKELDSLKVDTRTPIRGAGGKGRRRMRFRPPGGGKGRMGQGRMGRGRRMGGMRRPGGGRPVRPRR